jgi:hypothetical protein
VEWGYCVDEDGDGFCKHTQQRESWIFPDCVDSPEDSTFTDGISDYVFYKDLSDKESVVPIANPSTGWGKLDEPIMPWHIHPFSSVTEVSCSYGKATSISLGIGVRALDVNCNKNGILGANYDSLFFGGTPFDSDLHTGREVFQHMDGTIFDGKTPESSVLVDMTCALRPIGEDLDKFLGESIWTVTKYTMQMYGFRGIFSGIKFGLSKFGLSEKIIGRILYGAVLIYNGNDVLGFFLLRMPEYNEAIRTGNLYDNKELFMSFVNDVDAMADMASMLVGVWHSGARFARVDSFNEPGVKKRVVLSGDNLREYKNKVTEIRSRRVASVSNSKVSDGSGCFLENTSVMLENGSYIDIEDLEVGMSVVAWDLEENKSAIANVTYTFVRNDTNYRIVEYG